MRWLGCLPPHLSHGFSLFCCGISMRLARSGFEHFVCLTCAWACTAKPAHVQLTPYLLTSHHLPPLQHSSLGRATCHFHFQHVRMRVTFWLAALWLGGRRMGCSPALGRTEYLMSSMAAAHTSALLSSPAICNIFGRLLAYVSGDYLGLALHEWQRHARHASISSSSPFPVVWGQAVHAGTAALRTGDRHALLPNTASAMPPPHTSLYVENSFSVSQPSMAWWAGQTVV